MQFLKRHYEKIILSIVLLGLATAAALMPIKVSTERQRMEERKQEIVGAKPGMYKPVNLSTNEKILARVQSPVKVQLFGQHNLFNPVKWQRRPDGTLIKIQRGDEIGMGAAKITAIKPLELKASFDEVTGTGDDLKYTVTIIRETDRPVRKNIRQVAPKAKNNLFAMHEVKGPPENPTAISILVEGDKEPITLTKGQPYSRVVGYSADFAYPPESVVRKDLHEKDAVTFAQETYNIVAINPNEVVFSAKSNGKTSTLKLNPSGK
ncbi:MAG: hypothetical protein JWM99_4068 [Verrucomicrobiales bacterium]|nr:hypothetical protein [Verrucomicrobiales bacterium]